MIFSPPAARRALPLLILSLFSAGTVAEMRVTEFMYNSDLGKEGEFIEFTNVGALPVDMTGWSFDDSSRTPDSAALSTFGVVLPGESVILTEATDLANFRSAWGLCAGVRIIGGLGQNLGRSDEINLYGAADALVDRLTYNDQAVAGDNAKAPRTNNYSAWVPASALGANIAKDWVLSTVSDAESSWTSVAVVGAPSGTYLGGSIASPGKSTRATVAYDACAPVPAGHPDIVVAASTTPRLSLSGPYSAALSGVLIDSTDPARYQGIDFTLSDGVTPAADLILTASSSNAAVVADGNLSLSGSGATRNLKITPSGAGRAIITVTVTDGDGHATSYYLLYAVSAASATPSSTRFHTGACDASTALAVDASYMFLANDEDQMIRLYERGNSGFYRDAFDFTNDLGLTDLSGGVPREVDIEAATQVGSRIYWLGSHSNSAEGAIRINRYRLFATDVSGSGAASSLAYVGRYDNLRTDLLAWDAGNGHGLGANALGLDASAANGVIPEMADGSGFNIEALVMAPDGTSAFLGFRAPLQNTAERNHALIVPVQNFAGLIGGAGPASFGAPILLDLEGRAIRALERAGDGQYLILAGPTVSSGGFALYVWDGNAATPPQKLTTDLSFNVNGGSFEGIVGPLATLAPGTAVQLVVDNGDTAWYGDGICKESGSRPQQKFRSEIVTLAYGNGLGGGVEDGAPNPSGGGTGDGNGDGTQDSQQDHVASLLSVNGQYVTLAAEPGSNGGALYPIVEMESVPVPAGAPADMKFPFGAYQFRVLNVPLGGTVNLSLYLPGHPQVNGYYKPDNTGTWHDIATSITTVGNKQRVNFALTDGGPYDEDGLVNGQILDQGGPTYPYGMQAIPALSLPGLGLLSGLLAGLGWKRRRG